MEVDWMSSKNKTIACRVCGKDFKPCDYCQEHGDIYRWRNFACSKECAYKYFETTVAYRKRESLGLSGHVSENIDNTKDNTNTDTKTKRRSKIKEESEQIE